MNFTISDHLWFMSLALEQAEIAYKQKEVPVGSIVVSPTGEILSRSHNLREAFNNPIGHAEILALSESGKKIQNWRLSGCIMYVTLEPCPMCLGAMVAARIDKCVFGAYDTKGGAVSLGYRLNDDLRLNHRFSLVGGIKHFECSKLLSQFFRERRGGYLAKN